MCMAVYVQHLTHVNMNTKCKCVFKTVFLCKDVCTKICTCRCASVCKVCANLIPYL